MTWPEAFAVVGCVAAVAWMFARLAESADPPPHRPREDPAWHYEKTTTTKKGEDASDD